MASFYESLEVSPRASHAVIRAAYRCLAQLHHPDKNSDSADAGQRQAVINRAYAVLSDPQKRRDYDLGLGLVPAVGERRGQGAAFPAKRALHANAPATSRPFGFRPLV